MPVMRIQFWEVKQPVEIHMETFEETTDRIITRDKNGVVKAFDKSEIAGWWIENDAPAG